MIKLIDILAQRFFVNVPPLRLAAFQLVIAAATVEASFFLDWSRWLRCKAGNAINTIAKISPAIAKTRTTSMIVNPFLVIVFCH